jgi:o-succinylbenzoate synthase
MRVERGRLLAYRCRLPRRFGGGARDGWIERRGWLLRLEDDRGELGQGEAAPLPGYSPDTLSAAGRELERALAAALPLELDTCLPLAPQIGQVSRGAALASAAARSALECALLDLAGRRLDVPVSWLLRGAPAEPARPTAQVLPAAAPAGEAERAWRAGYRTLKVKVGAPDRFEAELAALEELRRRLPRAALRVDAGGAWVLEQAPDLLRRLAGIAPEFVEQPVPAEALERLAGEEGLPRLAADESLQQPDRAERLASRAGGPVRVLVLKPGALGGPLACMRLADRGRRSGLDVVVSHLLEGPVGFAAAAELALALPPGGPACGLGSHPALDAWSEGARPPQSAGHEIRAASTPGLGLPPVDPP